MVVGRGMARVVLAILFLGEPQYSCNNKWLHSSFC